MANTHEEVMEAYSEVEDLLMKAWSKLQEVESQEKVEISQVNDVGKRQVTHQQFCEELADTVNGLTLWLNEPGLGRKTSQG